MAVALQVPWDLIEKFCITGGGSIPDAAAQFNVKADTIRKRAARYSWLLPRVIERAAAKLPARQKMVNQAMIAHKAESWEEKGEAHRRTVFDLAHGSLKKMKQQAPRNFREAEAADKMARRAAGLENIDTVQQSLILVNDAISGFEPTEVMEAEVVESTTYEN